MWVRRHFEVWAAVGAMLALVPYAAPAEADEGEKSDGSLAASRRVPAQDDDYTLLYGQVAAGAGWFDAADSSLTGPAIPVTLLVGLSPTRGFALGAGVSGFPGVDVTEGGTVLMKTVGGFVDFYAVPAGFRLQLFVGWGAVGATAYDESKTVLQYAFGGGYDWSLVDHVSAGVMGRLSFASVDSGFESDTISMPAIVGTLTYR